MASVYGGYTGRVMLVNLTEETVREYPWSDAERKKYLGGKPMAYKLLFDYLTGEEQAFSEENWIVISTGPLTLSGAPSSSRYDITTISPRTNAPVSSNCGGEFGIWLKRAGYDALILAGRCKGPRWLEIRDDRFLFHDAASLWGTNCDVCREALDCLMDGQKHGSLYIGPAGENGVRFASIMDGTHTSGRTGIGAVFGWKNLKAIAVTGTRTLPVRNADKAAKLNKKYYRYLHAHPLTGKNSHSGKPASHPCVGCPILCRRQFHKGANPQTELYDRLGMDSGSVQDVVDWAYGAAEQGVFQALLPPREQLCVEIALRRGAGNELAEGISYLTRKYDFRLPKGKDASHDRYNRDDGYFTLLRRWGLDPDSMTKETLQNGKRLYSNLCEALSAAGLCMFAVNGFCPEILLKKPNSLRSRLLRLIITENSLSRVARNPGMLWLLGPLFWHTRILHAVSGLKRTPGQFIQVGVDCAALEYVLSEKFRKAEKDRTMENYEK